MRSVEIRWSGAGWYCDIHDEGKHRYRQLAPSEYGVDDVARVLKWAAELWPDAAFQLHEMGETC